MFKSKHSGWTWELRRTPFGDGGGSFNPISVITDPISSVIGTDGSGGGALGALASIDPGPAIGSGLAQLDKGVTQVVPGGWGGVAAITAAILTYGASLPESEAAFAAADAANLAGQGLSQEAIAQNLVASYGMTAEQAAAAATAAAAGGQAAASAATQALPYSEVFDASNLASQGLSSSAIQQNLAATGLNDFLAQDMANLAAQGLSPTQIGQALSYSYSPTELSGTGINSMQSSLPGRSLMQSLGDVKSATNVAKLLKQGVTSGLTNSLGQLAQGANPQGQALTSVVHGNQNPFTYTAQQPIQDNKQAQLASLLKQG
jgi:hypothetical protein